MNTSPAAAGGDVYDDATTSPPAAHRLRLMVSHGGRIVPRPSDKSLCYVGGETRILAVDRRASLASLLSHLSRSLLAGRPLSLKYQLPGDDLDALVSVSNDDDLENMLDELENAKKNASRLRLFVFPARSESAPASAAGSLVAGEKPGEDWFVDVLNGAVGRATSVNSLLGLDGDTASSFGSTSSGPLLSGLATVVARPDDSKEAAAGAAGGLLSDEERSEHGGGGRKPLPATRPALVDTIGHDSSSRGLNLNLNSGPNYQPPVTDATGYVLPEMKEQQQLTQQTTQQYIPVNPHYSHQQTAGTVMNMPSYYHPIASHQIQQSPQVPMYYLPVRQNPAYNLAAVPNPTSGHTDPNSIQTASRPVFPISRISGNSAAAPLVRVGTDQSQAYTGTGYHVMHQQQHHNFSQVPANLAANFGYQYAAADSMNAQVYYSQAMSTPGMPPQFQTGTSGAVTADIMATRAS